MEVIQKCNLRKLKITIKPGICRTICHTGSYLLLLAIENTKFLNFMWIAPDFKISAPF